MHKANFWTLENYPSDHLVIREIKNCVVTRSLFVMTAKGISRSCLYENLPLSMEIKMNVVGALSVLKNELHVFKSDRKHFFLFSPWSKGYYHWLTEVAIKPLLFREELLDGIILLPENTQNFVTDFFDLFGFNNLKTLKDNVFFKKLSVVTNPRTNHYNKEHIFLLRDQVLSKVEKEKTPRKLYVSRKNAKKRKVVNEDELSDGLKQLGFECVDLENTPFTEQVKLFGNCETLVSIHGAALTNSIFMPAGSSVIELYPDIVKRKEDLSACYYRLSKVLGNDHRYLFCETDGGKGKVTLDSCNINVALSKLKELL